MTQREQTLDKYLERVSSFEEIFDKSVQDAIHDEMKEHAKKFLSWTAKERFFNINPDTWVNHSGDNLTTGQLYNKFNLK